MFMLAACPSGNPLLKEKFPPLGPDSLLEESPPFWKGLSSPRKAKKDTKVV